MDAIAAIAVADALDALSAAIRANAALPGEPKAARKSSKSSTRRKPRSGKPKASAKPVKSSTARKSPAKPKAARTPRKVESVVAAVEPGNLTVSAKPTGKAKPSAKQTVRKRWIVEWVAADGTKFTHRTKFRFFAKAEAAADLLRNRGLHVTITPTLVAFKRKSKTTRQARTSAKLAAAKAA